MAETITRSFTGGEIAPSLYARADTVKYATALKTCRNMIVQKHGGVRNRPGFQFICTTKSNGYARLHKFVFNDEQTYVLEFGNQYMRVIQNGVQLESGGNPYEISTPYDSDDVDDLQFVQSGDVVTIVHPDYAPRELSRTGHTSWTLSEITFEPSISGPTGIATAYGGASSTALLHRYKVTAVKADTGEESLPGYGLTASITGATKADPVEITTGSAHNYETGDEVLITGVGGMTELNGRTFFITDTGSTTFTLNNEDGSGHTTYTSGGTSTRTHGTHGTAASRPSMDYPITVSWDEVSGAESYIIYKESGNGGDYGYLGESKTNVYKDGGTLTPDTSDSPMSENNPFDASGDYPSTVTYYQQRQVFANTDNDPEKVWMSQTGNYHVFSKRTPSQANDSLSFTMANRQVQEVRYILDLGELVAFTSQGEAVIRGDSDGVVRGNSIPVVKYQTYNGSSTIAPIIINNNALYVQARGGVVRDFRYNFESDGYAGQDLTVFANHLFSGYTLAHWDFQQIPFSVAWAARSDGTLLGLTYLPEHQIWGWHRHDSYDSTGAGDFLSVIVVPEGEEDVLYAVIKRTIDGGTKRYIERMASPRITSVATDCKFLDSFLTYDGRSAVLGDMHISQLHVDSSSGNFAYDSDEATTGRGIWVHNAGTGDQPLGWSVGNSRWEYVDEFAVLVDYNTADQDEPPESGWNSGLKVAGNAKDWTSAYKFAVYANDGPFTSGDVGNEIVATVGNDTVTLTISSYVSANLVEVTTAETIPASMRSGSMQIANITDWSLQVNAVSGLGHLEGETVTAMCDGTPVTGLTVSSGAVSLGDFYAVAHVGLPITSQIETLSLQNPQGSPVVQRSKLIPVVTVMLEDSMSFYAGPDSSNLYEYGADVSEMTTRNLEVRIKAAWETNGRVMIQHTKPYPLTILGIIPKFEVGG